MRKTTVGSAAPVVASAASKTTTALFVPSERTTAICEPSGDHDGKPNCPLRVSDRTRDDPSVATIESDPSVFWTAIDPVEAIGWPTDAEPAGTRLAIPPLGSPVDTAELADAAGLADGAYDGEGGGVAQPATKIARITLRATPRDDLIGQRYASHLPADAPGSSCP